MAKSATFMIYRGDLKKEQEDLAAVTISAENMELHPRSQFLDLRDKDGKTFATLTWKSTVQIRKIGESNG